MNRARIAVFAVLFPLASALPAADPDGASPAPVPSRIADRYPGDAGIGSDPAVLFHEDFENGWGKWDHPQHDTRYLSMVHDPAEAHGGDGLLRSTVTRADLARERYISSAAALTLSRRVDVVYWRYYARFRGIAPKPHHWVRMEAGTEAYEGRGQAGIRPAGDEGFRVTLDIDNREHASFYVYWHGMRSGRCNDGGTTPGCAGDQGMSYFYGNVFKPASQDAVPADRWVCFELMAKANTVGERDGELALWIDDEPVGRYQTGQPTGTWLRARFHSSGCEFDACGEPAPFAGFEFRTSTDVRFKRLYLDAYYQHDSFARKKAALLRRARAVSDEQTIEYDDIVVATERIGCRRKP